MTDERQAHTLGRIPMARFGHVEELAGAAVYWAAPAAACVTGVVLPVDGGFLAAGMSPLVPRHCGRCRERFAVDGNDAFQRPPPAVERQPSRQVACHDAMVINDASATSRDIMQRRADDLHFGPDSWPTI